VNEKKKEGRGLKHQETYVDRGKKLGKLKRWTTREGREWKVDHGVRKKGRIWNANI